MEQGAEWDREEIVEAEVFIRSQLRRWIQDEDDLADVTQECLRKVWAGLGDFRGDAKMTTWLYRIAHNEALSWLRREETRARAHQAWEDRITAAPTPDTAERITGRVEAQRVLEELRGLDRTIVEMTFFSGMTSVEIGSELEMAASSVRCRINRLKTSLRASRSAAIRAVDGETVRKLVSETVQRPLRGVPEFLGRTLSLAV